MNSKEPFKWRHFQQEIILLNVRWYLRYPLSYRNLEEMMLERGLKVDHSTICRWVLTYSPEIEKRTRRFLKPTNDSWKVDETYIKVNGKWKYLYRAVDSEDNTLDFMLSARRNKKAAKRFFKKVLKARQNKQPRVINVDKNAAYPPAIDELKEDKLLEENSELRQVKYLNNLVEQDHRGVKKITNYGLGYKSFYTAWRTIRGIEIMHVIDKGQVEGVTKKDVLGQKKFVESLFGIAI
ncbi:IS6 family transposase [Pleurocapsa sp. PCC 7319]|uniref:IS6 family transposase n=1 Tax=Pleurocapsa sp. PCC 7319 TaxID=118161 RepID=UPI000344C791|nr:IS6 family transposase [Pleurocapsa sp. PCC 7319]